MLYCQGMSSIQRTISVSFEHRVYFTRGVFGISNSLLQSVLAGSPRMPKVLVVLDESLALAQPSLAGSIADYFTAFPGLLDLVAPPLIIEGGERVKNSYLRVSEIHSQIDRHHVDRQSYVVGVGGGAVLDVVVLAAATAHRGVRHVRIPTTVLSQNDSGVGVKNGINAFTYRVSGKSRLIRKFKTTTWRLYKQSARLPSAATNIKIFQAIVVYIGNRYSRPFFRQHMRNKRLLVKINKIVFLMLPF